MCILLCVSESWGRDFFVLCIMFLVVIVKFVMTVSNIVNVFASIENEMREIMQNFEAQAVPGFPRIIGVIDGTHIRIKAPLKQRNAYFNRKKFYSFNTQASVIIIHAAQV